MFNWGYAICAAAMRANMVPAGLRYHGEWGVKAQIFKQGDLLIGRRFDTRELAAQWAEEDRKALEHGDQ